MVVKPLKSALAAATRHAARVPFASSIFAVGRLSSRQLTTGAIVSMRWRYWERIIQEYCMELLPL